MGLPQTLLERGYMILSADETYDFDLVLTSSKIGFLHVHPPSLVPIRIGPNRGDYLLARPSPLL